MSLKQPFDITIGGQRRGSQNYSWAIDPDGNATFATVNQTGAAPGTQTFGNITISGALTFGTSSALTLDAPDILALRHGTTGQILNVYNTFTNASNYEKGIMGWSSNQFFLSTGNAGTGSDRDIVIKPGGGSAGWEFQQGSTTIFRPAVDSGGTIGDGTHRPSNIFSVIFTAGSATTLITSNVGMTDYAAAQAGTLLNAPVAGNPTKWIAINDNGTVRKIPAW